MKVLGSIGILSLLCAMFFAGCSDDPESAVSPRRRTTVEVSPAGHPFVEITPMSSSRGTAATWPVTRAWTPPTGYHLYDEADAGVLLNGMFSNQSAMVKRTIGVFFTQGSSQQEKSSFYWSSEGGGKWNTTMDLEATTYRLYGFIPEEVANGATLSAPTTATGFDASAVADGFVAGATLTLHGLSTVTPSDVCVIVGAKEGSSADTDNGIRTGQFAVETQKTGPNSSNHIFLLFDHLYSALRFSFKVDAGYASLRTIRIKELQMRAYNDGSQAKAKTDVTIVLKATTDGSTPIVGNITYTPVASSSSDASSIYQAAPNEAGIALSPTTATDFRGCFTPAGIQEFDLITTYDVYDNNITTEHPNGNLVRKGCMATNRINIDDIFSSESALRRGKMFTVNLTVNPTYLYMLSEPDLDNPTVEIED